MSEGNPYNQELTISEAAQGVGLIGGLVLRLLNTPLAKKTGLTLTLTAATTGQYLGNKYRKYANHDGRSTLLEHKKSSN